MENTVHAPWIRAPATRAVIDALMAGGDDVRFVGGCVRDALLRRESRDIDIGTPVEPEQVLALLERSGIETRTVPRGIEHGTVTALAGGNRYEITTLRRDERTDGRHAEVAFTDDWREDAARRDFTINAMSAAPDGTLYDYFGGQQDLAAGRVHFVGDPATRIAEDHLRLLRFFRFYAWYGRGEPDAAALAACKDAANAIPSLSGERVRDEMMELLWAPNPVPTLDSMQEAGVLSLLLPEAQSTERLARLLEIEWKLFDLDPLRRLAALIAGTDASAAREIAVRWRLSRDKGAILTGLFSVPERLASPIADTDATVAAKRWRFATDDGARLEELATPEFALVPNLDHQSQRCLIYQLGSGRFRDLVLLTWAAEMEGDSEVAWRAMLETAESWKPSMLPVTGADVLECDVEEGPEVGRLLRAVEDWWIERDFAPDRAALLDRLDALVAESRRG